MRLVQQTQQRTIQSQRISPRLVAAGTVLQMSCEELQLYLEQEAALNPALELVRDHVCPTCGRGVSDGVCWFCRRFGEPGERVGQADTMPLPSLRPRADAEEAFDPLERAQAPLTLREHVLFQAQLVLSPTNMPIAEYLVAGLNDDGLLETTTEEAAATLGMESARVMGVLSLLQTLDPPGVCARSVQEGVLIQLRELAAECPAPPLVEPILTHHWRDLANHTYAKIARALDTGLAQVEQAVAFIRENLHPYPGRLFHPPHERAPASPLAVMRPDIVLRRSLADYEVEFVRPFDFELRVSEAYRRLAVSVGNGADSPEHRLALEQYRRASWLMQSLAMREQTLRQIAGFVAAYQRPYLDTELDSKLKPLTRTRVAQEVNKHPSTISRAIDNKFVLLSSDTLVSFGIFFSSTAAPKTVIAEVLAREDPQRPLTDEQLRQVLRVRGFRVARRTVAKYRLSLRLPSSAQRGRH